jgi:hypothetical protein
LIWRSEGKAGHATRYLTATQPPTEAGATARRTAQPRRRPGRHAAAHPRSGARVSEGRGALAGRGNTLWGATFQKSEAGILVAPLGRNGADVMNSPIQAQIADSVADAEMACRANEGVILLRPASSVQRPASSVQRPASSARGERPSSLISYFSDRLNGSANG